MSFNQIKSTVEQKQEILEDLDTGIISSKTSTSTTIQTISVTSNSNVKAQEGTAPVDNNKDSASQTQSSNTAENAEEDAEPSPMKNSPAEPGTLIPGSTPPPWPNELEPLASFNCIFTLGVVSASDYNNSTFRQKGATVNILQSGGGITKPQTAVEGALGISTEFFIDDVEITSTISSTGLIGNTNAARVEFTVHEPYSMGLFPETLRIAANKAGYAQHLNIPYLLTIQFPGWDENNNSGRASYSTRMLPINIATMDMEVTSAGSVYRVTAVAYNEISLGDDKQKLLVDTSIKGRTISELLQSGLESLASQVNTRELVKEETKQVALGDQYIIMFPKREKSSENPGLSNEEAEEGATKASEAAGVQDDAELYRSISNTEDENIPSAFDAYKASVKGKVDTRTKIGEAIRGYAENPENINDLGNYNIIEEWVAGGRHPMGKEGFAFENGVYKRGSVELQLSDDLRTFTFKQGTRIQDIIEEVLMASSFAKNLDQQLKNPPEDGMIDYFKIETQTYVINNSENLKYTGKYPKIHVYRVVPYKVHINIFKAPTSATPGIRELKKSCAKQYNYIYTGQNTDVLNFDIKFNGFYQMLTNATNGLNATRTGGAETVNQPETPEVSTRNAGTDDNVSDEAAVPVGEETNPGTGNMGGSQSETVETSVARFFNNTLLNTMRFLARIDLEIMGDPYWISDSGLGNYNAGDTSVTGSRIDEYFNMNRDGAANYQNGEIHINVIFRTPIDYKPDGAMSFPDSTKLVYAFSGVYRVNKVTSNFEKNRFTQTLQCTRVLGQSSKEPASLIAAGDETNSLVNAPGGVFDSDRNIAGVDQNAAEKLAGNIFGADLANLETASESQIRELINGLDPLRVSRDQLASQLGLSPELFNDSVWTQLQDGASPEALGFNLPNPISRNAEVVNIVIDPFETLNNFANNRFGNS